MTAEARAARGDAERSEHRIEVGKGLQESRLLDGTATAAGLRDRGAARAPGLTVLRVEVEPA